MNLLFRLAPAIWGLIWGLFGDYLGTIWGLWFFHVLRHQLPGSLAGWLAGRLAGWLAGWPAFLPSRDTVSRLHIQAMILATAQRPQRGHDGRAVFRRALKKWCQLCRKRQRRQT